MSSIGKYRRNVLGLKSTFWAGVSGSFFPLLQNIVRAVTEHNLSRWHAFYVNFIFLDSLLYLFYISIFWVACLKEVQSVPDIPRNITFYASRPAKWEPRRPKIDLKDSGSVPVPGNSSSTQIVKAGGFEDVHMMRKTVDSAPQHLVTIYQSPNSCCQKIGHQDAKKLNIRKPKLTHVRENASADGQMSNTSKHRFIYLTKH